MRNHAPKQVRGYQAGVTRGDGCHRYQPALAPGLPGRPVCRRCRNADAPYLITDCNGQDQHVCGLCEEIIHGRRPA